MNAYPIIRRPQKYRWTISDDRLCAYLYIRGETFQNAHRLLPHIPINSIKMKFQNCLFLDRGNVRNSLSNCSRQNIRIFNEERAIFNANNI
jgi:hypothetical protein